MSDNRPRIFKLRWLRDALEGSSRFPWTQSIHVGLSQKLHSLAPCDEHPLSGVFESSEAIHHLTNWRGSVSDCITDALNELPFRNIKVRGVEPL